MTLVVHKAANFHPFYTSKQSTLNNENSNRVHDGIFSAALTMNIPAFSGNVLQNHMGVPPTPLHMFFFQHPRHVRLIRQYVWTAVNTINSRMYYNNRINHELTNFDFIPLGDSEVKTCH